MEDSDGSDDALLTVSTGITIEEVETIETILDATQFNDVKILTIINNIEYSATIYLLRV